LETIGENLKEVAPDGVNRNRGWKIAQGDFIIFIDADDSYTKNRISSIISTMQKHNFDLLLHSYSYDDEIMSELDPYSELWTTRMFYQNTHAISDSEKGITDETNNEFRIHHAHISIRNSEEMRSHEFTDRFPGADTEFCKKVITSGLKTVYSPLQLSKWNRDRSFRYKIRLVKRKIGRALQTR
jgi:glycosyltransferase involved in cell wall biosynthesis